jgi:broad specificity phosphatase PhoE
MRLIIVRHGETEENKAHILQGHLPGKLSELGKEQAKKVALRLKEEKIDVIYSSDLARATDTAKEIAEFHPQIKLHLTEKLRERNLDNFTGKEWEKVDWTNPPQNLEPKENMRKRIKELIDEVYSKYSDKTVLFVGHGGINKSLILLIRGQDINHDFENQGNTAINIFEISEDYQHKIHCLNCTKHLD